MKLRHSILSIPSEGVWLDGRLSHAPDVRGLAVILLPSAVSRHEPPESGVATALQAAGYATLLLDLVTHQEDIRDPDARFNVPQMTNRLLGAADWIAHQPTLTSLPVALIAVSTTSAAAIRAASKAPGRFGAIICRAGRPDLAGAAPLRALTTPTRIVVGSEDADSSIVSQAFSLMGCNRDWQVVPDAGASFVEPGALEAFSRLAIEWLDRELGATSHGALAGRDDASAARPPETRE